MATIKLNNAGNRMEHLLKKCIEIEQDKSKQAYALSLLGQMYFESDDIRSEEQGMECCAKAMELDPRSSFPYYTRANFLCDDLLKKSESEGKNIRTRTVQVETAVRDLLKSMELNGGANHNSDEITLLDQLFDRFRWDDQEKYDFCEELLKDYPSSAPIYYYLAMIDMHTDLEDPEIQALAMEYLNKSIEYNPDSWTAYNNRGVVYGVMNNYDDAIRDFTKAIDIEPTNSDLYKNRGFAYCSIGDIDQAIKNLKRAIPLLKYEGQKDELMEIIIALQGAKLKVSVSKSDWGKVIHLSAPTFEDQEEFNITYNFEFFYTYEIGGSNA